MKLHWTDRAIGYFDPEKGLRRAQHRIGLDAAAGYDGTEYAAQRKRGREAKNRGVGESLAEAPKGLERDEIVEKSLKQIDCNPIASGIVDTKVSHIVGRGFRLQPRVDGELLGMSREATEELNDQIVREWELWADSSACDYEGMCSFADLTSLMYRSMLETGDGFCLFQRDEETDSPYQLRLHVLAGDRIASPGSGLGREVREIDGVAVNARGQVTGYYIDAVGSLPGESKQSEYVLVPVRGETGRLNVSHLFRKVKAGQKRGLPDLAPVLSMLNDLGDYSESELKAAKVASYFTVFIRTMTPDLSLPGATFGDGNSAGGDKNAPRLGPAAVMALAPNEDVTIAAPARPQGNFDAFTLSMLRQIGMGIGIPLEIMIQHFEASYSASRAALVLAYRRFFAQRQLIEERFALPVYREWFAEAVEKGRIDAPEFKDPDPLKRMAYVRANFVGLGQPSIDADKAAKASGAYLDLNISTLSDEVQEHSGRDWRRVLDQKAREKEYAESVGLTLGASPAQNSPQGDENNEDEQDPMDGEISPLGGEQERETPDREEPDEEQSENGLTSEI